MRASQRAVAARAASLLLRYPGDDVLAALPTVRAAVAELPDGIARPLTAVADHLARHDPRELAAAYVELFDFRRRSCLYLTYYTHGDTRARGQALAEVSAAYRTAGFTVDGGELPDYLPAVLELAATAGDPGWRILRTHRVGLDLLVTALDRDGSIYRHVIEAVRELLPPAMPGDDEAARRLAAAGPPTELVGLEPFPAPATPGGRR